MSKHEESVRIMLFDEHTGRPAGEIEIPQEIIDAARRVETWMREHQCKRLHGLHLTK